MCSAGAPPSFLPLASHALPIYWAWLGSAHRTALLVTQDQEDRLDRINDPTHKMSELARRQQLLASCPAGHPPLATSTLALASPASPSPQLSQLRFENVLLPLTASDAASGSPPELKPRPLQHRLHPPAQLRLLPGGGAREGRAGARGVCVKLFVCKMGNGKLLGGAERKVSRQAELPPGRAGQKSHYIAAGPAMPTPAPAPTGRRPAQPSLWPTWRRSASRLPSCSWLSASAWVSSTRLSMDAGRAGSCRGVWGGVWG